MNHQPSPQQGAPVPLSFVLSLGLLGFLVPLSIDLYVPSLPQIGPELGVGDGAMQWTLTVYLLAMAGGQLVFGPFSDAWGRRGPLLIGLAVFIAGAVLCALTQDITVMLIARFIQGVGGSATVVTMNASIRDRVQGPRAAQLYAVVIMLATIAPIIAPAAGGVIAGSAGWRWCFWAMALGAVLVTAACWRGMPESQSVGQRVPLAPMQITRNYRQTLRDRRFLTPVIGVGLMYAVLFMVIGGTPFVLQRLYGLSVVAYGVVFGVLAVCMALVAPIAGRLAARIGEAPTARSGAGLVVLGGAALAVALWLQAPPGGRDRCPVAGHGRPRPDRTGPAQRVHGRGQEEHRHPLGSAWHRQYLLGALATPLSGLALAFGAPAWGTTMLMVATSALAMAWWGTARPAPPRRATLGAAPSSLTDPEPPAQRDSMNLTSD